MKKKKNSAIKNGVKILERERLESFYAYAKANPDQRFWQALRNWSKVPYILKSSHFDSDMFDKKFVKKHEKTFDVSDTFYEGCF